MIKMNTIYNSDEDDGAVLQYTTDVGVTLKEVEWKNLGEYLEVNNVYRELHCLFLHHHLFQHFGGRSILPRLSTTSHERGFRKVGLGGERPSIHFEACLPALAFSGNLDGWPSIRICGRPSPEPSSSDALPLGWECTPANRLSHRSPFRTELILTRREIPIVLNGQCIVTP